MSKNLNKQDMEQTDSFLQRNRTFLIGVVVVILLLVVYFATRDKNQNTDENQTNTQNEQQEVSQPNTEQNTETPEDDNSNSQTTAPAQNGNISASGTLKPSDNAKLGNLMVESAKGKVYINTKRDFANLVGQTVTLQAQGTLDSFTFLGFNESQTDQDIDTTAKGGGDTQPADQAVSFAGTLKTSNQPARGNYMIVSPTSQVYLMSKRNYSPWLGQAVILKAQGSIQSFHEALLYKK